MFRVVTECWLTIRRGARTVPALCRSAPTGSFTCQRGRTPKRPPQAAACRLMTQDNIALTMGRRQWERGDAQSGKGEASVCLAHSGRCGRNQQREVVGLPQQGAAVFFLCPLLGPPPRNVCTPTARQATADLVQWIREEGTLALTPVIEHSDMIWHTELRAMKNMGAGAVGVNCGDTNLTLSRAPQRVPARDSVFHFPPICIVILSAPFSSSAFGVGAVQQLLGGGGGNKGTSTKGTVGHYSLEARNPAVPIPVELYLNVIPLPLWC